jgi:hypothetical protein
MRRRILRGEVAGLFVRCGSRIMRGVERQKARGSVAFLRCVLVMCGEWGNGCTMPDVFEGKQTAAQRSERRHR